MLSSFPSLRKKQHPTKDQNSFIVLLIGLCSIFAALLLYLGSQELYKVKTLVIRYCQVTSLGLKYQRHSFFPHWNITMIDENKIKDDFLIESIGTRSERWAWINARKYKINETYPCYRSQNQTSVIQWSWQWNKPTKLKAYAFLFSGATLVVIAVILLTLRRHFQIEIKNTRRTTTDSTIPLKRTSPTNDKVVQQSMRGETRV